MMLALQIALALLVAPVLGFAPMPLATPSLAMQRGATSLGMFRAGGAGTRCCGVLPMGRGARRRGVLITSTASSDVPASKTETKETEAVVESEKLEVVATTKTWPNGDKLDKTILLLTVPAAVNFLVYSALSSGISPIRSCARPPPLAPSVSRGRGSDTGT